jgi:hypothetical protein
MRNVVITVNYISFIFISFLYVIFTLTYLRVSGMCNTCVCVRVCVRDNYRHLISSSRKLIVRTVLRANNGDRITMNATRPKFTPHY